MSRRWTNGVRPDSIGQSDAPIDRVREVRRPSVAAVVRLGQGDLVPASRHQVTANEPASREAVAAVQRRRRPKVRLCEILEITTFKWTPDFPNLRRGRQLKVQRTWRHESRTLQTAVGTRGCSPEGKELVSCHRASLCFHLKPVIGAKAFERSSMMPMPSRAAVGSTLIAESPAVVALSRRPGILEIRC